MNPLRLVRLELQPIQRSDGEEQYDLTVLNLSGRPIDLRLDANDASRYLFFTLVKEITVPGGSEQHLSFTITPRQRRRLRRRAHTFGFTVSAQAAEDPAAFPVTVNGEFEEQPTKLPVARIGAAAALLLLIVAAGAFALNRGGSHTATVANNFAFTARLVTATNQQATPASICYHLAPENVPFHVVLSDWTNGKISTTLDEWDDDGRGGGDCVELVQGQAKAPSMMVLQAFVNGVKVGQAVLSSLTY